MTCYGARELADSFRTVRQNTIEIATDIPAEHYGFVPAPGCRPVSQLLAHVALSPRYFWVAMHETRSASLMNFDFFAVSDARARDESTPRAKPEIIALLEQEGETFARFLEGFTDEELAQGVTSPQPSGPTTRSRLQMLLSAKEHEMHHRGQLMLIQRQLGIVPHLTRRGMAVREQMMKARAGV